MEFQLQFKDQSVIEGFHNVHYKEINQYKECKDKIQEKHLNLLAYKCIEDDKIIVIIYTKFNYLYI